MTEPARHGEEQVIRRNTDLIHRAAEALNPQQVEGGAWIADVGAAVESASGEVFTGASMGGYLATCAEQGALSQMVSKTGPAISRMVAVWREPHSGDLHVIPPCGRCREAMRALSQRNLQALIILGPEHSAPLKELLPFHGWYSEKASNTDEAGPPSGPER